MIKQPEELRNKLIYARELPPLDLPTAHCFCGECADTLYDSLEYKARQTNPEQTIKEPCEICKRPGYDCVVRKRRYPLNSSK